MTTATSAAPAATCRYCARREFVRKAHGNNRVWRCVLSDTIIATSDPACRDYDHYDARKGAKRPRVPHIIVRPTLTVTPKPKPVPKYRAGDACPRCGSWLLSDWGDLVCLLCGTQHYGQPWEPSPSAGIWPPSGQLAEWEEGERR